MKKAANRLVAVCSLLWICGASVGFNEICVWACQEIMRMAPLNLIKLIRRADDNAGSSRKNMGGDGVLNLLRNSRIE